MRSRKCSKESDHFVKALEYADGRTRAIRSIRLTIIMVRLTNFSSKVAYKAEHKGAVMRSSEYEKYDPWFLA
jgi:hypothetical protein